MGASLAEKHRPEPEPDITPIPLMQLATAFWAFKTLSTAIDMDLFTRLETSPMNPPELARWLNIEERPAEMILTGCAGLGLLSKQNGRYRNTPLAENFLVRGGRSEGVARAGSDRGRGRPADRGRRVGGGAARAAQHAH